MEVKLSDINSAARLPPAGFLMSECGFRSYMSPEMLLGFGYTTQTDMWAVGVVAHLLMSGKLPFERESDVTLRKAIWSGPLPDFNSATLANATLGLVDLAQRLLERSQTRRLTSLTAMQELDSHGCIENASTCSGSSRVSDGPRALTNV